MQFYHPSCASVCSTGKRLKLPTLFPDHSVSVVMDGVTLLFSVYRPFLQMSISQPTNTRTPKGADVDEKVCKKGGGVPGVNNPVLYPQPD